MDVKGAHGAVVTFGHLRVPGRGDLVEAIRAVDDPHALRAQHQQRAGDQFGELRPGHTDDLARRRGWIGERTEQVECGTQAQFLASGRGVLHRRMKGRREEKRHAGLGETSLNHFGRRRDADAQRLEHVRTAASARHGTVAVLGDTHPAPASTSAAPWRR
jgi:hypothetical protein